MKLLTTFKIVISSLSLHACAMETFPRRPAPTRFPSAPTDLIENITTTLSGRILQNDELQCPICGHLSAIATFNPNAIPFPESSDDKCEMKNTNEVYEALYLDPDAYSSGVACTLHRSKYEERCCELSGSQLESTLPHTCEENIQSYLLTDSYKSSVAPSPGWGGFTSVWTTVRYWANSEIDITVGKLQIIVEINLTWNDPRLAWNITADNCAPSTFMRASLNAETTDIWVPSIDLANRESGFQSFPEASAKVFADGTVQWVRMGKIDAFCSFVGLRRMPYDSLGCQAIFKEPIPQKVKYYLTYYGDESARGILFPEYNQTYTEYKIEKEKTKTESDDDDETFTVNLFYTRARQQYINVIIWPTIFFVYMSFGQFFYDPTSEERISFCANVLLIVVAQNIVTSSYLPTCDENIWLNSLTTSCQYFVLAGILEALLLFSVMKKRSREIEKMKDVVRYDAIGDRNMLRNDESQRSIEESKKIDVCHEENVHNSSASSVQTSVHVRKRTIWIEKSVLVAKKIDYVAMFVFPLSFTVFLIIVFATNKRWEDDPSEIWNIF